MFLNSEILRISLLVFFGVSAGGIISAGIFAFLAIIGVFPRMISKSATRKHILLFETAIILGGVWGNVADLYGFSMDMGILAPVVLALIGFFFGIFVGSLVMSLAETLKALPVLNRRIHLAVGLQYVIGSIAIGKFCGAMLYFTHGFGGA